MEKQNISWVTGISACLEKTFGRGLFSFEDHLLLVQSRNASHWPRGPSIFRADWSTAGQMPALLWDQIVSLYVLICVSVGKKRKKLNQRGGCRSRRTSCCPPLRPVTLAYFTSGPITDQTSYLDGSVLHFISVFVSSGSKSE